MILTDEELKKLVDTLVTERVKSVVTQRVIESAVQDVVTAEVKSAMRAVGSQSYVRDLVESSVTRAAQSLVSSDTALIERCVRSALTVSATVDQVIRAEVKKMASTSIGQQVAARMRKFFSAVDSALVNDEKDEADADRS